MKTLCVLRMDGTLPVLEDQVESLIEVFGEKLLLAVVGPGELTPANIPPGTLICPAASNRRFDWAHGIRQALESRQDFTQVFALSSDTLLLRRGLAEWLAMEIAFHGPGVLGVQDYPIYSQEFEAYAGLLYEWGWPVSLTETTTESLADGFFFTSRLVVEEMYQHNWLVPPGCERWALPYGVYLSWLNHSLGRVAKYFGQVGRPSPPLFMGMERAWQPSPHILSPEFRVYRSARTVSGYNEDSVRAWAKTQRAKG